MSTLPPSLPPESGGIDIREAEPPPSPPAPSPENDDISPPTAPNVQIPPLLPPPERSDIFPTPLASPPLSTTPIVSTPPPTPSPTSSPPPPPPTEPPPTQNPPQKNPHPPIISPPITQKNPPSIFPPVNEPVYKPPTPPIIKANPATPASASPPLERPPPLPALGRDRTGPEAQPSPTQPGPLRPRHKIPLSAAAPQSLPTSAVLPSPPPVALPVPQSPDGGAWLPFSAEGPAPLPSFPGVVHSPAAPLLGKPSGGSSQLVPSGGDIEASVTSSGRSSAGLSSFVVGLCVGGVLLLILGIVFAILGVFCKRRKQKRFDDHGSGNKYEAAFSGFEDKISLPQYTKQSSNSPAQQVLIKATSTQRPTITSNGSSHRGGNTMALAIASPTPGLALSFSGGTFTYDELARATDGFSEHNLLGQGGFGYVHKGVLPNGKEVAVKQLKMGGHQGEREFQAEVETISQVHHKHLVSLVGYCIAGSERLLVYEFVPNNTMEFHLHGKRQPVMDWPTRLKIAIGAAKGLAYLHEDCSPTIIHRDIKASNILLDFNFEAKVSDFGLAKIFTGTNSSVTHITTRVVGTFGYLAPEYASSGKVTDKSDVYSYGVMLLELITGRPPISSFESATNGSLVNWARPLLAQAIGDGNFATLADHRLQHNYNVDEMTNMVASAAACVRLSAWRRPRMSQVVRALEGNLSPSELDDGTRPGDSAMQFPYESLDFDAHNYMENLKRMALTSNNGDTYATSRYSDNTSDYGLHPSASSTETPSQYSSHG